METRNLGNSGLRVSLIGLGGNNFGTQFDVPGKGFGSRLDLASTRAVVFRALDLGITLIDTADIYSNRGGSESALGEVLGDRRKDIVLATKFGLPMDQEGKKQGGSRRYMMQAVEDSLRRLRTDWIDLYQIHQFDPATPQEETLRALDDLVRQGKVRYIGCSNYAAWQMVESQWISRQGGLEHFISCQNEYSLLVRDIDSELVPAMQAYGTGFLPFFPLASGLLTGKYKRNQPAPEGGRLSGQWGLVPRFMNDRNWDIVEKLERFARERGHTLLELAFSWLACRPTVASVIAGATRPEQIEANVKAANWKMSAEEMAEIDTITVAA